MDSDHRHDLKENDLEHFLANFGDWWKKYGSTLLLWVLLIALVLVGWNLWHSIRSGAHNNAWDDLAGTTSPDTYPLVAEDHSVKGVKILANLWGADAQLRESLTATGEAASGPGSSDKLAQAEAMYQQVLALTDEPVYRANAYLGLASVAESRRAFDKAATFYDQAIAAAGETYAALKLRAEERKAILDRLAEPVVFGKTSLLPPEVAPEVTPEPTPEAAPEVTAPSSVETPAPATADEPAPSAE